MRAYLSACTALSCKGRRRTSEARLLRIMGTYAASRSHRLVVKRVLKAHLITIKAAAAARTSKAGEHVSSDPPPALREAGSSSVSPAGRARTASKLRSFGFVADFTAEEWCRAARKISEVLRGRGGADGIKAKRSALFIHRFVVWARAREGGEPPRSDWSLLTSPSLPAQFVRDLSLALQPASVRNHAGALLEALELVRLDPGLRAHLSKGQASNLRDAAAEWTRLKRVADRGVRSRQRAIMAGSAFQPAPLHFVANYLQRMKNYGVLEEHLGAVETWAAASASGPDRRVPKELVHSWRTVLCYLALLIMMQGQRLCVAINLTVGEFERASWCQGLAVVRIRNHKTGQESGPAAVCLKRGQHEVFRRFCAARKAALPPAEGELHARLLVSPQGAPVRGDSLLHPVEQQRLSAARRRLGGGEDDPEKHRLTFNWVRKSIETGSEELLPPRGASPASEAAAGIMRFLCHSAPVTRLHYRFRTDAVIVKQYKAVELVVCNLAAIDEVRLKPGCYVPATWSGEYEDAFL